MNEERAWNAKTERNREVFQQRLAGWTLARIARHHGISYTRVYQLLLSRDWRRLRDSVAKTPSCTVMLHQDKDGAHGAPHPR